MKIVCALFIIIFTSLGLNAQDSLSHYTLNELDILSEEALDPEDQLLYGLAMLDRVSPNSEKKDTTYAKILFNVGRAYRNMEEYLLAEEYLLQTQEILLEISPQHKYYAYTLHDLGFLYYHLEEYQKSEQYYLKALALKKDIEGSNHPDYASSLGNLGLLYFDIGDYIQAEKFYLEALFIEEATLGSSDINYAYSLGNLGILYVEMGEYEKAESYCLQGLAIEKEFFGENDINYAFSLGYLGALYHEMKLYKKAENYYLQGLAIEKEILGEDNPDYAISLNNISLLYSDMEEYEKAESYALQCLDIDRKLLGENHPDYASSLGNLGLLYHKMARYTEAEYYYLKSFAIEKNVLQENDPNYIISLNNLGELQINLQNYEQAWEYAQVAIKANSSINFIYPITPYTIEQLSLAQYSSYDEMNKTLLFIYDLLEAQKPDSYKEQQQLVASLALQLIVRSKNELSNTNDKLRILEKTSEWTAKSLLAINIEEDADQAFKIVDQGKGVLLLDASTSSKIYQQGLIPNAILLEEKELQNKYNSTKALLAKRHSNQELDSIRNELNMTQAAISKFEYKLEEEYPKYVSIRFQHDGILVSEVQDLLPPETALIEYMISDNKVYIFYIDQYTIKTSVQDISSDTLNYYINNNYKSLSNYQFIKQDEQKAFQLYTRTAHWLYEHLLATILEKESTIKKLLIIPDGKLNYLPFETFLVEEHQTTDNYSDLHYLIQDYDISYNYSASLWKENMSNNKNTNNGQLLGTAANYQIQLDSTKKHLRLPSDLRLRTILNPLPYAKKEIQHLKENYYGNFVFDSLASEQFFKDNAEEYAIIHLALHGLLNSREPLLSSIAFTENSDSLQDNFLYTHEILKMNLNADLIVLSACETGFGKFEVGNGTASLARAFMYAGAPAMIVSLWEVNDISTKELMQSFYANLEKGIDKDQALRQAKLQYIKSSKGTFSHPAYWSPFILMGNNQPVNLYKRTTNSLLWWISGSVLLLGGFFYIKKKYLSKE